MVCDVYTLEYNSYKSTNRIHDQKLSICAMTYDAVLKEVRMKRNIIVKLE